MSVVILVPVFAPGGELEGAEPPDILAGVSFGDVIEMREAVHEALHVQGVDQADRAEPEKAHPAQAENRPDKKRQNTYRRFEIAPDFVDAAIDFGGPAIAVGRRRLI